MNRSFQSVVIAFFASILLISGCSSGSSTGVSFSRMATPDPVKEYQCFEQYLRQYPDLAGYLTDNGLIRGMSTAQFGLVHYQQIGAIEGRRLPYGCERYVLPDPSCLSSYVLLNGDLKAALLSDTNFLISVDALNHAEKIWRTHRGSRAGVTTEDELSHPLGIGANGFGDVITHHMAIAFGYQHWSTIGRFEGGRTLPATPASCRGAMVTNTVTCVPGSRFPNCIPNSNLADALVAAVEARAAACAATGGTINNDTGICTPAVVCTDGWDEDGNAC